MNNTCDFHTKPSKLREKWHVLLRLSVRAFTGMGSLHTTKRQVDAGGDCIGNPERPRLRPGGWYFRHLAYTCPQSLTPRILQEKKSKTWDKSNYTHKTHTEVHNIYILNSCLVRWLEKDWHIGFLGNSALPYFPVHHSPVGLPA